MNDEWTTSMDQCSVEDLLRGLPHREPDVAHSARVRQRCHKVLARRSKVVARPLESALVGGFCAVYFAGVALMALHTHGLL